MLTVRVVIMGRLEFAARAPTIAGKVTPPAFALVIKKLPSGPEYVLTA
jgi:hypothetical protein